MGTSSLGVNGLFVNESATKAYNEFFHDNGGILHINGLVADCVFLVLLPIRNFAAESHISPRGAIFENVGDFGHFGFLLGFNNPVFTVKGCDVKTLANAVFNGQLKIVGTGFPGF